MSWSLRLRAWPVWNGPVVRGRRDVAQRLPFSGMPFGRLAYATAGTPWADALPWLGMTGVSLLVALTGTTLAWLLVTARSAPASRRRCRRRGRGGDRGARAGGVPPHAERQRRRGRRPGRRARHRAGRAVGAPRGHRQPRPPHARARRRRGGGEQPEPDLVVWPENSTAVDPFSDPGVHAAIVSASDAIDVPILVGAVADDPLDDTQVLNQGIDLPPGTRQRRPLHQAPPGALRRVHPVPRQPDPLHLRQAPDGSARHGARHQPRAPAGGRGACGRRDLLRRGLRRGDRRPGGTRRPARHRADQHAMFSRTAQLDQQFEISRLRAQETGPVGRRRGDQRRLRRRTPPTGASWRPSPRVGRTSSWRPSA